MGDGLYLKRRREAKGKCPMNPQQQQARRTVADELRASLRKHELTTETRIAGAVAVIEQRAAVLTRPFLGRLKWLVTGN